MWKAEISELKYVRTKWVKHKSGVASSIVCQEIIYLFIYLFQEEQESLTTPKEQISFNEDQLDYEPEVNGD